MHLGLQFLKFSGVTNISRYNTENIDNRISDEVFDIDDIGNLLSGQGLYPILKVISGTRMGKADD